MGNEPVRGHAPKPRMPNGNPGHPSARFVPGRSPQRKRSTFLPGYSSATALPALWIAAILVGGVALVMIVSTITFAVSPHHSTDVPAPFVSTSAAAQSAEPTPPKPCFPFQTDC